MDPTLALQILQWVAIVVVYLGLAAVLRETHLLRAQVTRLQSQLAATSGGMPEDVDERLPARVTGGRDGVVVVADTTCPSCALVLEGLTERRDHLRAPLTLLTWEPEESWAHLRGTFPIVRDDEGWSTLAHLSPPLLVRVAADGRILGLHLPASTEDVDATLTAWGALAREPSAERGHA